LAPMTSQFNAEVTHGEPQVRSLSQTR
jgi:hypothetical protein